MLITAGRHPLLGKYKVSDSKNFRRLLKILSRDNQSVIKQLLNSIPTARVIWMLPKTNQNFLLGSHGPPGMFLWWLSHQIMFISWVWTGTCDQMCLCTAGSGCNELMRKWFCHVTLQIGFMNNGVIKAVDVEYYINGGCTPDESQLVNENHALPIGYLLSCMCYTFFAWIFLIQIRQNSVKGLC